MEDSVAIYWPQRRLPAPESVLQVSLDEARANTQALFPGDSLADFRLLVASQTGVLYAQARLPSKATHLVRSRNQGKTWDSVWSRKLQFLSTHAVEVPVEILGLALNAGDPDTVFLGTTDGLYQNNQRLDRPPSTLHVATVALHPQYPDLLYMATRAFTLDFAPRTYSGQGLYRRRQMAGEAAWEDLSPNLPGQVQEIGFDSQDANQIYVRTEGGQVYSQVFPPQLLPQDFGWRSAPPPPPEVQFDLPALDLGKLLRVWPDYPAHLIVRAWTEVVWSAFEGYPFARGHVLYAQGALERGPVRTTTVLRSRDGGVSWVWVGGFTGIDLYQFLVLCDNSGQVRVWGNGLPGVAADHLGPWTYDPLDPSTLYVAQQGQGLLYRSQDLDTWEDLSQGLDPTLQISGVAVDSLSTVYLRTDKGIFRKQGTPHPFRIAETRLQPDTLNAGSLLLVSAKPLPHAGHRGVFAGSLSAEFDGQRYPMTGSGIDGVYTVQLQLDQAFPVGFNEVAVFLEVPGQPLARASQRLEFMVVPSAEVPIYRDEVAPAWQAHLDEGTMDLQSGRAFAGKNALQVEGKTTWQYSGQPLNPFAYELEFYAAGADLGAIYNLQVDGQSLVELYARLEKTGGWTRVVLPMERLVKEPLIRDQSPVPAFISALHFNSPGPTFLDEIQIRPSSCAHLPCVPEENLPPPAIAAWGSASPDTAIAGVPFRLESSVEFDRSGSPPLSPYARADLSNLDGPSLFSLKEEGEGRFLLSTVLTPTSPGPVEYTVTVLQLVGHRLVEQTLARKVVVLPAGDQVIYADGFGAFWNQGAQLNAQVHLGATEQVYEGREAIRVDVPEFRDPVFTIYFHPAVPLYPIGYDVLHYAFHLGEATAAHPSFVLRINGHNSGKARGVPLDLTLREWQVVEVPIAQLKLKPDEAIEALSFVGNMRGAFYLDDIRLVAARPSVLPPTVVAEAWDTALPQSFHLDPNYPNPFNPSTTLRLSLPASAQAELAIYNLTGQKVVALFSGLRQAGTYTLQWDGRDDQGRELASGVYFCRLQAGNQVETRKLLLLR